MHAALEGGVSAGRFSASLAFLAQQEGGWSDRPADRGGPTKYGITGYTLARAQREGVVGKGVVLAQLTRGHAERIYRHLYWKAARCGEFPAPFDLVLFDAAVNHGPAQGVRLLQRGLRVSDDGLVGPVTIAAARSAGKEQAHRALVARGEFYHRLAVEDPTQEEFIGGWLSRLLYLRGVVERHFEHMEER